MGVAAGGVSNVTVMHAHGGHGHSYEGRLTAHGARPDRQYGTCGRLTMHRPGMPR